MIQSLSGMSATVNFSVSMGCHHILWRRQGSCMRATQKYLLYLLPILQEIRRQLLSGNTGMTIEMHRKRLIYQVTITLSTPRCPQVK